MGEGGGTGGCWWVYGPVSSGRVDRGESLELYLGDLVDDIESMFKELQGRKLDPTGIESLLDPIRQMPDWCELESNLMLAVIHWYDTVAVTPGGIPCVDVLQ